MATNTSSARMPLRRHPGHSAIAPTCAIAPWSYHEGATLLSVKADMAESTGANLDGKITVASFSAEVSAVLGVDFPNMEYIAAYVGANEKAAPQLASGRVGAEHVYVAGKPMCLRHGHPCSLKGRSPIDVLLADGVDWADLKPLVAARTIPARASGAI